MKETIQINYYSLLNKISNLFGEYKFSIFNKAFKKMLYLKLKRKYNSKDLDKSFNQLFNNLWNTSIFNISNTDYFLNTKIYVSTIIELGINTYKNNSLKSMCGIQPMDGPVSLLYYLKINDESNNLNSSKNISLNIMSAAIAARTKKFKTNMAVEVVKDSSHYDMYFNKEIFDLISKEIDGEFVKEFILNINNHSTSKTLKIKSLNVSGIQKIINEINLSRMKITATGNGNVVWVNPLIGELLEKFHFIDINSKNTELDKLNVVHIGTLNKTVNVYSCDYINPEQILLGYKGNHGEIDAGVIFSSYVPLGSTGVVMDTESFQPVILLYTRYGIFDGDSKINEFERYNYYRVINLEFPKD